jgi:GR25 family glycosyltransferase involved in LPS biosynthesis
VTHSFDTFFDKILVINVASNEDRWENAQQEFSIAGIHNYERIDAVTPDTMESFGWKWPVGHTERGHTHGQFKILAAIRSSFFKAFQHILTRGYKRVLIMEDDFSFDH